VPTPMLSLHRPHHSELAYTENDILSTVASNNGAGESGVGIFCSFWSSFAICC